MLTKGLSTWKHQKSILFSEMSRTRKINEYLGFGMQNQLLKQYYFS
jgi:hypothetical protein